MCNLGSSTWSIATPPYTNFRFYLLSSRQLFRHSSVSSQLEQCTQYDIDKSSQRTSRTCPLQAQTISINPVHTWRQEQPLAISASLLGLTYSFTPIRLSHLCVSSFLLPVWLRFPILRHIPTPINKPPDPVSLGRTHDSSAGSWWVESRPGFTD